MGTVRLARATVLRRLFARVSVQDYWVCDSCKSLVRSVDAKCYSCGRLRASDAPAVGRGAQGAVLTPGVDDEFQAEAWRLSADHRYVSVRYLAPLAAVLVFLAVMISVVHSLVGLGILFKALDLTSFEAYLDGAWIPREPFEMSLRIGIAELIVTVAAAIACIALVAISVRNAPVLGAGTPPRSALGAVLWWFVPLLNLVRPYQIVSDVYARLAVRGSVATKIVGAWWACFLLAWFVRIFGSLIVSFLVGFGLALGWRPTIREAVGVTIALQALEALFYIGAGIILVRVLLELGSRQRTRARWIASGAAGGLDAPSAG
jgi:hypothetical protein